MNTVARVVLWGTQVGAVTWDESRDLGVFQYTSDFHEYEIQIAPFTMMAGPTPRTWSFPSLAKESFHGLPGLLADSLPDKFGTKLIDAWLASQGRGAGSMNPVERLCYTGTRGMGALEFLPAYDGRGGKTQNLNIERLVKLANKVIDERNDLEGALSGDDDHEALQEILRVGTSAGGARAKAVLAWNPDTGEFRSGQVPADEGFESWLLKFDGVHGNRDKELADPMGFGRIERAYSLMAKAARIDMSPCRLHEEGGRAHFMTKRFDRTDDGEKIHMLSLGGMRHFDYNQAGAYGYEQAIETIRQLGMPAYDLEQQVRRTFFNIIARNHDDHVKNIAFLMDRDGNWRLSPAFDVAYAYNPSGPWTSKHQMSVQGKRDGFSCDDLIAFAKFAGLKARKASEILGEVLKAVGQWKDFAEKAGVPATDIDRIQPALRLKGWEVTASSKA